MRHYLFLLVVTGLMSTTAGSTEVGTISGRVFGPGDKPVASASVYLLTLDGPSPARPSITKTNAEGKFSIDAQPGNYAIHAFKPDDGYPDVTFAFELSPDQKLKEVRISAGQRLENVDIRLGPKAAILNFNVTDAETGLVISSVDYELCQVQHPDWCLRGGSSGSAEFTAPATEILIQLGADGHKSVRYTENGKTSIPLTPGEHKTISVALRHAK
jgi:hypothetical protein